MKKIICFLTIALYFSSCFLENQPDDIETEAVVDTVAPKTENPSNELEISNPEIMYYEYEGTLEGNIPIQLSFHQSDELVKGELIYKKVGKPITIIGTVDEGGYYRILEFGAKGMVTGILSGNFKSDAKNLSWFSPESRKSLKMELELKNKKEDNLDLAHNDILGDYRYEFGKDGALGNLKVNKVTKDSIYFDLSCLTQAPARNMATMEEAAMVINGNKISIDYKEGEFYDCAYDILFYKDFAWIKYVDDRAECGFGHNAHVDGIFLKVEEGK